MCSQSLPFKLVYARRLHGHRCTRLIDPGSPPRSSHSSRSWHKSRHFAAFWTSFLICITQATQLNTLYHNRYESRWIRASKFLSNTHLTDMPGAIRGICNRAASIPAQARHPIQPLLYPLAKALAPQVRQHVLQHPNPRPLRTPPAL